MSVSVMDYIPVGLWSGIEAGTDTSDLTTYFQDAAAASLSAIPIADPAHPQTGTVRVPNGLYHIGTVGIGYVRFVGESISGTVIKAYASAPGTYLFDAQIDVDGSTGNTIGAGWCESMTLDGALDGSETLSGMSGLRTYAQSNAQSLHLKNLDYGLSAGLPMWSTVRNVVAENCNVGFNIFAPIGQNGTSTTFLDCWANRCRSYGFQVMRLHYSSFVNCAAQECGTAQQDPDQPGGTNWYFQSDPEHLAEACVAVQLIGCASEGTSAEQGAYDVPFRFERCEDFTIIAPRIVRPTPKHNLITFVRSSATIIEFSSAAAMNSGRYHLDVIDPPAGRSIAVVGGRATWNPTIETRFTRIGTVAIPEAQRTTSSEAFRVGTDQVVGARRTGWQAPTGTADRTGFDTATVGLAPLAQRVKALIDDLTLHGLIGN